MTERFAIVGAGQMGNGIAHVCATSGFDVTLIDVSAEALAKGRATIEKNLERQVKKGTLQEADRDATIGRIGLETSLDAVADAHPEIKEITNEKTRTDNEKSVDTHSFGRFSK